MALKEIKGSWDSYSSGKYLYVILVKKNTLLRTRLAVIANVVYFLCGYHKTKNI